VSRMCGSVSLGFTESLAVAVVSRIRVLGSSDVLLEAHPAAAAPTRPARIMCRIRSPLGLTARHDCPCGAWISRSRLILFASVLTVMLLARSQPRARSVASLPSWPGLNPIRDFVTLSRGSCAPAAPATSRSSLPFGRERASPRPGGCERRAAPGIFSGRSIVTTPKRPWSAAPTAPGCGTAPANGFASLTGSVSSFTAPRS
jgi:hypothetical protein